MKRILALSGGGVRGAVEVAFLEAIERVYQERGHERLSDVFHLVGGTSTGALIATAISLGKPVSEIRTFYENRAPLLFRRERSQMVQAYMNTAPRVLPTFLKELLRLAIPAYDSKMLEAEIRKVVGDTTLGDPRLKTCLGIVAKRLDTGSAWIMSNIPTSPFYDDPPDGSHIGNKNYELAKLLRASAAAPTLFEQESFQIAQGQPPGVFVDGGASPFNDPSFALLSLANMPVYGLNWPLGVDNMMILSLGTGRYRRRFPADQATKAPPWRIAKETLTGMVSDGEKHVLTLMEWLGQTQRPSYIDSEIGHLGDHTLFGEPAFQYLRLDLPVDFDTLTALDVSVTKAEVDSFRSIEDPDIIPRLLEVTAAYCAARYPDLETLLP